MEPDNPAALIFAVWFLAYAGEFEELRRTMEQRAAPASAHLYATISEMFKHAVEGRLREKSAMLTEEMTITARRDPMYSHLLADLYALGGMKEESLKWLGNALSRGWINFPFSIEHDPLFAPLREEPRFHDIADRMKVEWEEFGRELEEVNRPAT